MKKLIITAMCFLGMYNAQAQELEALLLAADDAGKLMENYMNPAMKGLMYNMNGGWYSTAKTHKKLGFDITIMAGASFVPSKDQVFTFNDGDYDFLSVNGGTTTFQTVMGDDADNTSVNVSIPVDGVADEFQITSFTMPDGIGISVVPTPMVQVGIGLPFSTDIKFRVIPKINSSDGGGNLFGVALQHDLMQHFGPLEKLPLNISILAGLTNVNIDYDIQQNGFLTGANQRAEFKLKSYTVQAIGSLDFPVVNIYMGLGYNGGSSDLDIKGDYTLSYEVVDQNGAPIGTISETVTDPISLGFDANGFRTTLGARLNLAFFKIFADYTLQEFNTLNAGIAFSFR